MDLKTLCLYGKFAAAGLVAVFLVSAFCIFYDNPPRSRPSKTGATAFENTPHTFFASWREGKTWGKTDAKGFRNLPSVPYDSPPILLMGSSQMEAGQVLPSQTCTALANEKLPDSLAVFNIGFRAHYFTECAARMRAALEEYQPQKYVILQCNNPEFSFSLLKKMVSGDFSPKKREVSSGIADKIIDFIPMTRILRPHLAMGGSRTAAEPKRESLLPADFPQYQSLLDEWLGNLAETAKEYHVQMVILFFPHFHFQKEPAGFRHYQEDPFFLQTFRSAAEKNGIRFIDMTDDFENCFDTAYQPAVGFINTAPGYGHLNKTGHKLIADRLYTEIMNFEGSEP